MLLANMTIFINSVPICVTILLEQTRNSIIKKKKNSILIKIKIVVKSIN